MSTQPVFNFPTYDVSRGRDNEASKDANPSDESKEGQRAAILIHREPFGGHDALRHSAQVRMGEERILRSADGIDGRSQALHLRATS
jgi:hypothetical protein